MTLINRIGKAVLSVLLASAGLTLVVYALGRLLAPEIPAAPRVYDAALLRERMRVGEGEESRWQIVEDPMLTRGGCRVSTDVSLVDASVEQRLAAVVARVLGEEREGERVP